MDTVRRTVVAPKLWLGEPERVPTLSTAALPVAEQSGRERALAAVGVDQQRQQGSRGCRDARRPPYRAPRDSSCPRAAVLRREPGGNETASGMRCVWLCAGGDLESRVPPAQGDLGSGDAAHNRPLDRGVRMRSRPRCRRTPTRRRGSAEEPCSTVNPLTRRERSTRCRLDTGHPVRRPPESGISSPANMSPPTGGVDYVL